MNIGQQISRYILEDRIGEGGFGDVFRARDLNTGMEVAIKCSTPDSAEGKLKDREQRFLREVSCISKLRHPNIVQLYDYGSLPDGTLYLVMEYVRGMNLEQLVKRDAPFAFVYACDIIMQVLSALSEAHTQGIVHRDLKPANIMLVRQGQTDTVKLLDFGIAKAFDGTEPDLTRQNFQNGAGFGTPQYMPPEQFYGKKIGPHSDLYAVGLVFYELLVGKQAFSGKTLSEIIEKQLKSFPDVPEPFNQGPVYDVFRRALAKQISMRYASAFEMHQDLKMILEQNPSYVQLYSKVAHATSYPNAPSPYAQPQGMASIPMSGMGSIPMPNSQFSVDGPSTVDTRGLPDQLNLEISGTNTLIFGDQGYTGQPQARSSQHLTPSFSPQMSAGYNPYEMDEMAATDDMSRVDPAIAMAPKLAMQAQAQAQAQAQNPYASPQWGAQQPQIMTPSADPLVSSEMDIATSCLPALGNSIGVPDYLDDAHFSDVNTLMVQASSLSYDDDDDELPVTFHEQSTKFLPKMADPPTEDLPPVFHQQKTKFIKKNRGANFPANLSKEEESSLFVRVLARYDIGVTYLSSDFYRSWRHFKHRLGRQMDYLYENRFVELFIGVCLLIVIFTVIIIIMILS